MPALNDYNKYPDHMQEMTEESWNDFFTYSITEIESRQAYKSSIYEQHEDLRIFWVNKAKGLGMCIGRRYENHKPIITHYRVGAAEIWKTFKNGFAAQFKGDNS